MSKNAVYDPIIPYQFNTNPELKRLSIMFDKIFIGKPAIPELRRYDLLEKPLAEDYGIKSLYNEIEVYKYLNENGIVEEYTRVPLINNRGLSNSESTFLGDYLHELKKLNSFEKTKEFFEGNFENNLETTLVIDDMHARLDSLELSKTHDDEFYPILKSDKSFIKNEKKADVIKFILSNIPQPDDSVSWEQIIDFRNDKETRLKYLALINWINDIARLGLSVNEIKEKYEYLYFEYKKSYERHNMKSAMGTFEILVAASVSFFTVNIPLTLNLASNFLKVGTTVMNLFQEEVNIPGKEIAYIIEANRVFK